MKMVLLTCVQIRFLLSESVVQEEEDDGGENA
jgi:hypothetical protein